MASGSVVVVEPWCKSVVAVLVRGEDLPVGPHGLQGPVEPLDLAVVPWAMGPDPPVFDLAVFEQLGERDCARVGPVVIGHHFANGDRRAFLVGADLGIREPGVVINDGVDVVKTDVGALLRAG